MIRTSAVQSVVEILRADIQQNYKPDDLLQNERLIAERFGVSRNTVREALIHLEAFGIIEKTQRGPRVCAPSVGAVFHVMDQYFDRSLKTCLDLLDFRRMIDIGALSQVVKHITDADVQTLEGHVVQMQRSLTAREDALADYAFHNEIVRISGNHVLETLYRVLSHTLVFYMEIGKSNPVNREKTFDDHRAIITALQGRSLEAAIKAFSEHYNYSEQSVRAAFEKAAPQPAGTDDPQQEGRS
jgi:DNA-binding FadR family transcriptional regulator